jgi:hypothetical protein
VRGDRPAVAPQDGTGEGTGPTAQGLLERCLQQGTQVAARILDPDRRQHGPCLVHEDHQVVRTVGESRVVQGTVGLGDHDRLGPDLHREGLRHRQDPGPGGDRDRAPDQPGQVTLGAGEGHGRVQGHGPGAGVLERCEHLGAEASCGVDEDLSSGGDPGPGDPVGQSRQLVVRDGEQHQFAAGHDRGDVQHRDPGQEDGRAFPGGIGDRVRPGDRVSLGS